MKPQAVRRDPIRRSRRADLRMSETDWRDDCGSRDTYQPAPTVQREPTWLIVYGLGMMAFGVVAGIALTLSIPVLL